MFRLTRKKATGIALFLAMCLSVLFSTNAYATQTLSENSTDKYICEIIPAKDIAQYPEVIEFIESNSEDFSFDNGILVISEEDIQEYKQQTVENFNQSLVDNDIDMSPVTIDDYNKILDEYGLDDSVREYVQTATVANSEFWVIRDRAAAASPVGVFYVTHFVDGTGYSMRMTTTLGTVDSVTGTVTAYYVNGQTWHHLSQKTFSAQNVRNGEFFKWTLPVEHVSEKFLYEITVTDNGVAHKFDNIKEYEPKYRYCFASGAYTSITPNGGERHHFVSKDTLSKCNYNTNLAFAMRMTQLDHHKTGSWGSSAYANSFRATELTYINNKEYQKLLQMEIDDFIQPDPDGVYKSLKVKYTSEISNCMLYYNKLFGLI